MKHLPGKRGKGHRTARSNVIQPVAGSATEAYRGVVKGRLSLEELVELHGGEPIETPSHS